MTSLVSSDRSITDIWLPSGNNTSQLTQQIFSRFVGKGFLCTGWSCIFAVCFFFFIIRTSSKISVAPPWVTVMHQCLADIIIICVLINFASRTSIASLTVGRDPTHISTFSIVTFNFFTRVTRGYLCCGFDWVLGYLLDWMYPLVWKSLLSYEDESCTRFQHDYSALWDYFSVTLYNPNSIFVSTKKNQVPHLFLEWQVRGSVICRCKYIRTFCQRVILSSCGADFFHILVISTLGDQSFTLILSLIAWPWSTCSSRSFISNSPSFFPIFT